MARKAPNSVREVEADLEATPERLRAYRERDPNFERAIADYVDAEASLKEDPAEGHRAAEERDQKSGGRREAAGAAPSWRRCRPRQLY